MFALIISFLKRLFVKYGKDKTTIKTIISIFAILFVYASVADNNVSFQDAYSAIIPDQGDSYNNDIILETDYSVNTLCDEGIGVACDESNVKPTKNRRAKKKIFRPKTLNKWVSKFKNPKRRIAPRVDGSGSSARNATNVMQDREWTMKNHLQRRTVLNMRNQLVQTQCLNRRLAAQQNFQAEMDNLIWTAKYHLIWCPVHKVAYNTWMKNFLLMSGEQTDEKNEKKGQNIYAKVKKLFPAPKGKVQLKTISKKSLKILIVRHPFERLLSAYRDIMLRKLRTGDSYSKLQNDILLKYGDCTKDSYNRTSNLCTAHPVTIKSIDKDTTEIEPDLGAMLFDLTRSTRPKHPTFFQFLLYVKENLNNYLVKRTLKNLDPHWMPIAQTCVPCVYQYDVIAHIETLEEDQQYIIKEAGLEKVIVNSYESTAQYDGYNSTNAAVKDYFSQIPLSMLKDLQVLYNGDFTLFGYKSDEYFKIAHNDLYSFNMT